MSSLTVIKNKDLEIKNQKMNCDGRPDGLVKPLQWNFSSLVCGAPGSGKSVYWMNLISRRKKFYWRQFDRIVVFSPSLKTITKEIKVNPDDLIDGFDMERLEQIIEEQKETEEHTLIILDDVVAELKNNMKPLLNIVYNRRHIGSGLSVIITTQKLTKVPLEIRVAMSNVVMFNKAKKELDTLFNEVVNLDRGVFDEIVRFVFDKPHAFLYLDLVAGEQFKYYKGFDLIVLPN
jgi:hypothetical protein